MDFAIFSILAIVNSELFWKNVAGKLKASVNISML